MKGDDPMPDRMGRSFALILVVVMLAGLASNIPTSAGNKSMSLSDAIAKVKWFQDLKSGEKESLKSVASIRRAKAGEKIIEQGKSTKKIIVVLDGKAQVLVDGKEVAILSGEFIVGEIEFLDMSPASADVILQQDADIIEMGNLALYSLMDKEPRIGYLLMAELARLEAERLRLTNLRWKAVGN